MRYRSKTLATWLGIIAGALGAQRFYLHGARDTLAWLLAELVARCESWGARQMVAVIGDSANTASINLHARLGFRHVGRVEHVGWKFGRWLDVVFMQRMLGQGASAAAD